MAKIDHRQFARVKRRHVFAFPQTPLGQAAAWGHFARRGPWTVTAPLWDDICKLNNAVKQAQDSGLSSHQQAGLQLMLAHALVSVCKARPPKHDKHKADRIRARRLRWIPKLELMIDGMKDGPMPDKWRQQIDQARLMARRQLMRDGNCSPQ